MSRKTFSLFDASLIRPAIGDAFKKLSPRVQWRNPVMFVVYVGSLLTTLLWLQALRGQGEASSGFILAVALWLWFTVLFANFAEALAEGRSKAQAGALRNLKKETWAKKMHEPRMGAAWYTVPASDLRKGDVILAQAGDFIPADGEVIEGVASVDESAITGESAPVIRESGGDFSAVTGGTRVLSDWVLVRVTVNPGETFVDRMIAMDELAHSNVSGARHPKRWQDVEELLAAGIDVYGTINVQHLDSLNDVVSGITGIRVWETVPDRFFDSADEVILVDLPPDELLQRLKEGKVYLPQQAERAIRNFFRKGNLIALRELALRRTADRVDEDMLAYRRKQAVPALWPTRESLLVCVGPDAGGERVVRSGARLANQWNIPWHAIYVETPALQRLPGAARERIFKTLSLAEELGAETATLAGNDGAAVAVKYLQDHNLSKVVVGRGRRVQWSFWHVGFVSRLCRLAPDLDVILIARNAAVSPAEEAREVPRSGLGPAWPSYLLSALVCAAMTLLATPLHAYFDLANIVMLFLVAVVVVALWLGRGPAVLASLLSVAAFDFFFVPPRLSFAVSDVQYLMTFFIMAWVRAEGTRCKSWAAAA